MSKATNLLAGIVAVVLIVFGFIAGVLHHDYPLGTFLGLCALCVAWLGGVIGSWIS